ncbi:MAG: hypothetical protein JWP57_2630 [Spirosoma sp.]|nr:hypothetical protein [Spirosoma sp.]
MNDGLYLDGVWVAEADISLNLQLNDLTKPYTIQASYSNSFSIPESLTVRDLTQNAEQIDAGGQHPYKLFRARLIEAREGIFLGHARLTVFKGGWTVILVQTTKSLFEALSQKSLRDMDLARYDHKWNIATITAMVLRASAGSIRGPRSCP